MKESLVDVSVLLIFFTRYNQFKKVFEQVKKARPSELFLYQDGPRRDNQNDIDNIKKCREIAENIDWDCKVHRLYQTENKGVDPSGYIADKWAFSLTDKCIVLEDDVVPSVSYFSFCKYLLDKYENDERIMLISGFNPLEVTKDIKTDYFFSKTTYTWGWASWKRVVDKWDENYTFLDDEKKHKQVEEYVKTNGLVKNTMNVFINDRSSNVQHFETILISNQYLNNGLTIVPARNMINNIGVVEDSSHYSSNINLLPRAMRKIFFIKRYDIDIENINEPDIIDDYPKYKKDTYRIYGWNNTLIKIYRAIEITVYHIKYGKYKELKDSFV